jgi:quercetin dioxygenase-like cupin family protein
MLSKVERGEKNPTLPVASRIAGGLGLSLSQLLGATISHGAFTVRRGAEQIVFHDEASGFIRELLSPAQERFGIEVVRHKILPGGSSGDLPPYNAGTHKVVIVERGRLRLWAGPASAELGPGDSANFEADVVHGFSNAGEDLCEYLLIISRVPA